jgi:16S rRNA (cytosine967-C5)-methyltransferase
LLDVQRQAAEAVGRVLSGRNLDDALAQVKGRLDGQQRAAVQSLSYGVLRQLPLVEAVLKQLLAKPVNDPLLHRLLLVTLFQLAFSRSAPHAVVDHAVRNAERINPRTKGLVNAVLRRFLREREALEAEARGTSEEARWLHPAWWIARLRRDYPESWEAVLTATNGHPPMTLRVNARRTDAESYLGKLREAGMAARSLGHEALMLAQPVPVERLPGFGAGEVSVQDAGAQEAARLLDAAPGMRVLDACAAPGGKTAHLLELLDLDLTALDSDAARLDRARDNLSRLGLKADVKQGDAADPSAWWAGRPFDRILADVPCTGSGVVRRHPDIKWLRRESDIAGFAERQARILDGLWQCLAPGGKLLLVTCSLFPEENQQQVERLLRQHADACLDPLGEGRERGWTLLPNEEHDGFFFARLAKV